MDDAVIVHVPQRRAELNDYVERVAPRHAALLAQNLVETLPVHVFHRVEILVVLKPRFVEADNVGMAELAERFDLALEALKKADVLSELAGQNLERRLPPGAFLLSEINAAHAAPAEFLENPPLTQAIADHG